MANLLIDQCIDSLRAANMGQLPTYILFENTTEVTRLPEVDFEAKSSSPTITKAYNFLIPLAVTLHVWFLLQSLLCRHFELDLHLLEYVSGK
ncbi:hypothetical protein ACLOJK_040151 [Asimina triloba]